MGGVELLSRRGDCYCKKRIEAGKDVMINALTQSPFVAKKIFEWQDQLEKGELLVRDIIDIDSTYEDFENTENNEEKNKDKKDDNNNKEAKVKNKEENKKETLITPKRKTNSMFHWQLWRRK